MNLKILLVGGGGREHALAWKIAQSPWVEKLYCAPGNPGIAGIAECVDIAAGDLEALEVFAVEKKIDLTVIGPEAPLVAGLADRLRAAGQAVFGPSASAAAIEGSKAFMKDLLQRHHIPTAGYQVFSQPKAALAYIRKQKIPIVVKASGLASGKGAMVCHSLKEAEEAVHRAMIAREFGAAGQEVVVEEFLTGEEVSFMAFADGERLLPLASAQDHKAIGEGDTGPNTGGMGAYSPAPIVTPGLHERIMSEIMEPVMRAMTMEGRPYRGLLYAGLMIDGDLLKVLEFNARFGDPETQPLLMRMRSDIVPHLLASASGTLAGMTIDWDPRPAVCVVMAAGGYPGSYAGNLPITGLQSVPPHGDVQVFHAGTRFDGGQVVTAGGRVLGVTGMGETITRARDVTYDVVHRIHWQDVYFRRDIAHRAIAREVS
ncbi:MAG: phosphoribosylamine--glycine ligase [Magnetococcales bacterium]|nr:phosphoribosylamine--glycine ligase [Magnetococcales bacterium]MBF0630660.1 phosphoribosylamine--glycine ligase [Magnetococcales bacterium]